MKISDFKSLDSVSESDHLSFFDINRSQSPNDEGRTSSVEDGSSPLPRHRSTDTTDLCQEEDNVVQTRGIRRSGRQTKMPIKFNAFVVNSNEKYGIEKYVSYACLNRSNFCFATTLNKSVEPSSYVNALNGNNWVAAMNNEIEALNRNNTWSICDLPAGRKPIGYVFVALLVYVDDIVITGNDESIICNFKRLLAVRPVETPFLENTVLNFKETEKDKCLNNFTSYQKLVMSISVISVSSDSSEESVGTSAGRVILFGTIPTTIPNTIPTVTLPTTHVDTTLTPTEIPSVSPIVSPSPCNIS
ncbi:ribonuclease H-like domain-containing protein [Tanacetum coccineum]